MSFHFSIFSDAVLQHARQRQLAEGEILFCEGDPADRIFQVVDGCVKLVIYPQGDRQMTLFRAKTGDVIGEEHLVDDKFAYTAIADEVTSIRFVPKEVLIDAIQKSPDVTMKYVKCISGRYHRLRVNFERLGIKSAKDRVFHLLMALSHEQDGDLDLSGKVSSFADDLNLTPESIYRALRELENDGWISREQGVIKIPRDRPTT